MFQLSRDVQLSSKRKARPIGGRSLIVPSAAEIAARVISAESPSRIRFLDLFRARDCEASFMSDALVDRTVDVSNLT